MIRAALIATLFATPALAAPKGAPAISVTTLKDVTRTLSSDAYGGRAPVSAEEPKTIRYIADRFRRAGLQPGVNGQWFQPVPMVEVGSQPTAMTIAVAGKGPLSLAFKTDMVVFTSRVVPRVDLAASEVVFVGYGVNAPELGWNDYAGLDVRGKTVVMLSNDPDWQTPTLDGAFGGRRMTYYGRWTYKYEEAARQGAAAALIVHDTEPAAYPWGVVVSSWGKPQLNLDSPDNHMRESAAYGWLTTDAATRLFALAGKDFAAARDAAAVRGFAPVPLGATMSVAMTNTIRRQASNNVIGVLPGRGPRAKEYVLYTSHWDHLGRCEPVAGDAICNGALDNATGIAGLVAIAERAAKRPRTARTQVFIAVTAEESGLLGSRFYAENPVFPIASTVGGVNMDGLNIRGPSRDIVVTGAGKNDLDALVRRHARGRTIAAEASPEKGSYYRSDHFSLAKVGVPMLSAGSGIDLVAGGTAAGRAAMADYTTNRYHKPSDEYDPRWDWRGAVADVTLYADVGHDLASGTDWPNWAPRDEFRAIRDKARASAQ